MVYLVRSVKRPLAALPDVVAGHSVTGGTSRPLVGQGRGRAVLCGSDHEANQGRLRPCRRRWHEPVGVLGVGELEGADALPAAAVADQLRLEQRVERRGEGFPHLSPLSRRGDRAGLGEAWVFRTATY
jgi:hypothetical protein